MRERSPYGACIVHSGRSLEEWAQQPPRPPRVRPARCPRCGRSARGEVGLRIVSHGTRTRRVVGALTPDGEPVVLSVEVARFRCSVDGCGAVLLVVPRGLAPRHHYAAATIGLSLCLWGMGVTGPTAARSRLCPGAARPCRRWAQPGRWVARAAASGRLFRLAVRLDPVPPGRSGRALARAVASQLAGWSEPQSRSSPEAAVVSGAERCA